MSHKVTLSNTGLDSTGFMASVLVSSPRKARPTLEETVIPRKRSGKGRAGKRESRRKRNRLRQYLKSCISDEIGGLLKDGLQESVFTVSR